MSMTIERDLRPETIQQLQEAVRAGRAKFPGGRFLLAALIEEVGELAETLVEHDPDSAVKREALQVAGVALRIYEEGDGAFPPGDARRHLLAELQVAVGNLGRFYLQRDHRRSPAALAKVMLRAADIVAGGGHDPEFSDIQDHEALP